MKGEASEAIVRGMKAAGVDLVAILPDHGFDRVQKRIAEDDSFTVVPVSNEAVGVGVCAGAFFGGKSPALMIPTSGFLVATWPLASLHNLWNIPLLLLIPYRGDIGDPRWMGLYKKTTEPGLNAMDIPYRVVSRSSDIVRTIKECNESARAWLRCIAVILNEEALW